MSNCPLFFRILKTLVDTGDVQKLGQKVAFKTLIDIDTVQKSNFFVLQNTYPQIFLKIRLLKKSNMVPYIYIYLKFNIYIYIYKWTFFRTNESSAPFWWILVDLCQLEKKVVFLKKYVHMYFGAQKSWTFGQYQYLLGFWRPLFDPTFGHLLYLLMFLMSRKKVDSWTFVGH